MDSDSSHTIEVTVESPAWQTAVTDPEHLCRRAVAAVLAQEDTTAAAVVEIGIVLADDARMRVLNRDFRGQDRATNVLSFPAGDHASPMAGQPRLLGDVVVALETMRREAAGDGTPLDDYLAHLLVHGTLHLLGYDHESDDEAERMEAREIALLAGLGIADPYHAGPAP
jgi:probable rRNA maturation factor